MRNINVQFQQPLEAEKVQHGIPVFFTRGFRRASEYPCYLKCLKIPPLKKEEKDRKALLSYVESWKRLLLFQMKQEIVYNMTPWVICALQLVVPLSWKSCGEHCICVPI